MPDENATPATPPSPPAPAPQAPSAGAFAPVVDFLSSVPLALFTLIALAATSIFGTVILQKGDSQQYLQEYGQGVTDLIRILALDDMYHSWWFLGLLALLLVNITLCSAKRFPRAWRLMTDPVEELSDDLFRRLRFRGSLRHRGEPGAALEAAEQALASRFGKPTRITGAGTVTLVVDRGWFGRLGVYITHLSIPILALGTLYGGLSGYRGDVSILEGQTVDTVPLRGKNSAVVLPFQVRCDRFTAEFYPREKGGGPKSFESDLVIIDGGAEVLKKRIRVNDPLRYQGWSFFQNQYGTDPSSTVTLEFLDQGGRVAAPEARVRAGDTFTVPNDPAQYVVGGITPNVPDVGGVMVDFHRYLGPDHADFEVYQNVPNYDARRRGPVFFRIKSADVRQYTGVEVSKDPGVPVVWLACTIMMAGLLITFFVAHRRVWVRVDDDPSTSAVLVAGTTSRNPVVFERDFEALMAELRTALKEKGQPGR